MLGGGKSFRLCSAASSIDGATCGFATGNGFVEPLSRRCDPILSRRLAAPCFSSTPTRSASPGSVAVDPVPVDTVPVGSAPVGPVSAGPVSARFVSGNPASACPVSADSGGESSVADGSVSAGGGGFIADAAIAGVPFSSGEAVSGTAVPDEESLGEAACGGVAGLSVEETSSGIGTGSGRRSMEGRLIAIDGSTTV